MTISIDENEGVVMGSLKERELKKKPEYAARKRAECPNCFKTVIVPVEYRASVDLLCDKCYAAHKQMAQPSYEDVDRRSDERRVSEDRRNERFF